MIRVTLIYPASRRYFLAQWDDPVTSRTKTRSTGETDRRKAERFAARLETEINSAEYAPPSRITWEEFCRRYKDEVSASRRNGTAEKTRSTMSLIDELISPKYLSAFATASIISKF